MKLFQERILRIFLAFFVFIKTFPSFAEDVQPYPCANASCFCIQVNEIGDLSIIWDQNNLGISNFFEHQFYADTGTGFLYIGSESDPNVNSFTYSNFYAALSSSSYYIKTYYGVGGGLVQYSDTISSIYFDLVNQFDGTMYLSWNHPMPLDSIPPNSYYSLEKSSPTTPPTSAVWNHVRNLPVDSTFTVESLGICADWVNYRVRLVTDNCDFISNIDGGYIQDQTPPDAPLINFVSNDTSTNTMQINWNPSFATDTYAYIIFKFYNGSWSPVDTVFGRLNTSYYDTTTTTFGNQSVQYAVAAMDGCSSGNPPQNNTSPAGLEHQNIHLNSTYDQCTGIVNLSWNPYINWSLGVDRYEVFVKNQQSTWSLAGMATNNSFNYFIQNGNLNYSFLVKAIADSTLHSSISNQVEFFAVQNPIPQYSYISSTSVSGDSVRITYLGDNSVGVSEVYLYRSFDNGINFSRIDSEMNPVFPITFHVLDASPNDQPSMYQVSVLDACGNEIAYSNVGKTIFLSVDNDDYALKSLNWNSYIRWEVGVENYEIHVRQQNMSGFQNVANLDSTFNSFLHDINNFITPPFEGEVCYKIKALEVLNSFGDQGISESNEVCIQQQLMVSIPNALYVGGLNANWKPILNIDEVEEYKVSIYNRLGQLVYELEDYNQFWDGSYQSTGELSSTGVFIYFMEFKTTDGNYHNRKGHITVIR